MAPSIPSHYRLEFSEEMIRGRVASLGSEISKWAVEGDSLSQILCVCVLRGGVLFFSDLVKAVDTSVELAFCRTWSYTVENHKIEDGSIRVSVETVAAQGRRVLIIDDICDTGSTLKKLSNVFLELGATEVKSAVLVHRSVEGSVFTPDWSCFKYSGDEWFVGYGMEDGNKYCNLPAVYSIHEEA